MILSGSLAVEAKLPLPMSFVYFPVMVSGTLSDCPFFPLAIIQIQHYFFFCISLKVHAFDILVSSAGILAVGDGSRGSGFGGNVSTEMDPLRIMKRGYRVALACAAVVFLCLTRWLLYVSFAPYAWMSYFVCGVIGMITSYIFILSTQVWV
jgi:hypothetical protein